MKPTETPCATEFTLTAAAALLVLSALAIAVTRTASPGGRVSGAVKTVRAPLGVCAGLKLPQLEDAQLTTQSTPWWARSFVTTAAMAAGAVAWSDAGGACANETEIGGTMLSTAVADLVRSVLEVAVMVTPPRLGTNCGAMYVVGEPLFVWAGVKAPQDEP